jgi:hypothetical protein
LGSGGIPPRRILHLGAGLRRVVSFTPRKRAPVTHWIGGWVDLRTCLEAVAKRKKFPALAENRKPVVLSQNIIRVIK